MVLVSVSTGISENTAWAFRFVRGGTAIAVGDAAGSRTQASIGQYYGGDAVTFVANTPHLVHLDSPNTTSATTYGLQARTATGTIHVNRTGDNSDADTTYRSVSTITVMEVAG
jgi:hypothetical protein